MTTTSNWPEMEVLCEKLSHIRNKRRFLRRRKSKYAVTLPDKVPYVTHLSRVVARLWYRGWEIKCAVWLMDQYHFASAFTNPFPPGEYAQVPETVRKLALLVSRAFNEPFENFTSVVLTDDRAMIIARAYAEEVLSNQERFYPKEIVQAKYMSAMLNKKT